MARYNRSDVETAEFLQAWENRIDDNKDALEDFSLWCRRHGWRAGGAVKIPKVIVTK